MRWVTEAMVWADAWPSWAWVLVGVALVLVLVLVLVVLLRLRGVEVVVEVRRAMPRKDAEAWLDDELRRLGVVGRRVDLVVHDEMLPSYKLGEYRRHNGRAAKVRTDGMSEEE